VGLASTQIKKTTGAHVDRETCIACGLCSAVCPMGIPYPFSVETGQVKVALYSDRLSMCIRCGHCMAICPTQSIYADGLTYAESLFELPHLDLESDRFFDLLTGRRSVRAFRDAPVPREMLERIVEAISLAPMSFTPHKVQITVVQRREVIERVLPSIVEFYEDLVRKMDNPLIRLLIRLRAGQETFNSLRHHVLPSLAFRLPDMKAEGGDTITRGAPSMLVFHAHREAEGRTADAWIALTYGLLAAHALGLGATAIGLVPPVIERSPEVREIFKIPLENQVLASMIIGYPRYRFQRGIRRELASVNWI